MPIFSISNNRLTRIKETTVSNELELQRITEKNLKEVLFLEFIKTEVSLGNLRIDTLAFDNELKSFVIIEYKKDKNFSVIDQGYAYLALLLNNKADFVLEYNEVKDKNMRRDQVDWSQSKVIFISPQFTKYQKQAINFRDLPIELWEYTRYDNGTILYNQLKSPDTSESIKKISSKSEIVKRVSKEIKTYTEENHLKNMPYGIKEKYQELKERILSIADDIVVDPKKHYIGFKSDTNFADINLQKSKIKIWVNLKYGQLNDSRNIAKDVRNIGHWGNGDYEVTISSEENIDYLFNLIEQSYKVHKK